MKNNNNLKALSQQVIQTLWQNKEYRNVPVELMRYFRQQSAISDAAVLCWQALHEMAFFDNHWIIQISKNSLAQEINKSPTTVTRILNELEKHGYIWRSQSKYKGYNLPNKIHVTLPPEAIEAISKKPDRKRPTQEYDSIDYSVTTDIVEQIEIKKEEETPDLELEKKAPECATGGYTIFGIPKSNINNNINNNSEDNSESDIVVSFFGNHEEVIDGSVPSDRKVGKKESIQENDSRSGDVDGEFDTSEILENQEKIESLELEVEPLREKRHEIVQSKNNIGCIKMMAKLKEFHVEHKQLSEIELEIDKLKLTNEKLLLANMQSKFDLGLADKGKFKLQKIKTMEAEINMLAGKRNLLMNDVSNVVALDEINKLESKSAVIRIDVQKLLDEDKLAKKKINVAYREGQRMLDKRRLERICYAALDFTGGDKEKAQIVAQHVIHSIRFGSLSKLSYKTGKTMTIPLATNVAIKLLRERRWENPKNVEGLAA